MKPLAPVTRTVDMGRVLREGRELGAEESPPVRPGGEGGWVRAGRS
jgi:hypothetical protein